MVRYIGLWGRSVLRAFIAIAVLGATMAATAGGLVLNGVTGQGGVQLSKQELDQLLPGASVFSY